MLKLKATIFVSVLTLAACSGGGSSGSSDKNEDVTSDLETIYNLPPAPDAELAKTQVIDTNSNGIRDEVERAIVLDSPEEDEDLLKTSLALAKSQQSSMDNTSDFNTLMKTAEESDLIIRCLYKAYDNDFEKVAAKIEQIKKLTIDTVERDKQKTVSDRALGGQAFGTPDPQDVDTFCAEYLSK